ncbi:MAG: rod shape-determining protein RodA [Spirochaetaceae bacterium]|jgi:rod shape determining protein RodA|nr:rod shape-determining protein RodA [Spirochaetaceae bacterium]
MKIRDFLDLDFPLLFSAVILTVFGILFIYSSGITSGGVSVSNEYVRQIIWAVLGFILAMVLAMSNYSRIYHISIYLYLASIFLLVLTLFAGTVVNGARAWLRVGSFGIQPSEFAKITTILYLSYYLDSSKRNTDDFKRFVYSCVICILPMGLVLLQPDFGTSLVWLPILIVITFVAGIPIRYVIFVSLCITCTGTLLVMPFWQSMILKNSSRFLSLLSDIRFIAAVSAMFTLIFIIALWGFLRYKKRHFYWIDYVAFLVTLSAVLSFLGRKVLKDYQIMRLIVFLDPNVDPRGSGWNIIQSITAIGSGGFWGKGFLRGTQSHYRFLPQQSTDFIFSIFSEEWGLVGGILVFVLFLTICLRLIKIMKTTQDTFGSYITAGFAAVYVFHFLINVGMTMGIMPITGIPLLFMSYGGSALVSSMTGIGLALSVHIRRFQY